MLKVKPGPLQCQWPSNQRSHYTCAMTIKNVSEYIKILIYIVLEMLPPCKGDGANTH